jgi:hypothetical protein
VDPTFPVLLAQSQRCGSFMRLGSWGRYAPSLLTRLSTCVSQAYRLLGRCLCMPKSIVAVDTPVYCTRAQASWVQQVVVNNAMARSSPQHGWPRKWCEMSVSFVPLSSAPCRAEGRVLCRRKISGIDNPYQRSNAMRR